MALVMASRFFFTMYVAFYLTLVLGSLWFFNYFTFVLYGVLLYFVLYGVLLYLVLHNVLLYSRCSWFT
jgi:hypothetical protein